MGIWAFEEIGLVSKGPMILGLIKYIIYYKKIYFKNVFNNEYKWSDVEFLS